MISKGAKWIGWTGVLMLVIVFLLALIGPYVVRHDAEKQTGMPFQPPGAEHWLGTNDMGQDIMAELVVGARTSLTIGIAAALLATLIGTAIGLVSGYSGGWVDSLLMRIVDICLTLPFLPLMIVIGVYMGPSLITQVMVITLVMWAGKARKIRAQTLSLRSRGAVLAAQSMGAGHFYILWKHIFPSMLPLVIPQFVQAVNVSIMMESSLSFLGMGDPLSKSWGSMLFYANSRSAFLTEAWMWWVIPPGLCIVITVLAFSFIGYCLEERVNPRLRAYQAASLKGAKSAVKAALPGTSTADLLAVESLFVRYPKENSTMTAVDDVSFVIKKGEVLGLVGESGSGKSTVAAAVMQLLKPPAMVEQMGIHFADRDLSRLSPVEMRQIRGNRIALIPQAAMNALNPVMSVREQLAEAILSHRKAGKQEIQERIDQVLMQVGLTPRWGAAFPHELSGGMRQRAVIAMALINEPELVIADEPTTGLDVKVQVEIIKLLKDLQQRLNLSMIFISHDLPVVLSLADRVVIMNQGKIVDQGQTLTVAHHSTHPYTRRLIDSIPRIRTARPLQEQR
ncbi:dipeptide/oligopeptide/nickel ABC transporter permease/ATP-binding protein [Brevibacillus centrosporus]|uniref:dipeptide/oligopeptide/nickel ABC transporter permease/ATP-binding protein n=1 Tax=Brevibacillus centrosporus TaxID=54910 RepID=UPI000F0A08C8|nr:dipeptide/oligopeptide/nickel ABC transporter permease/ATP-binding protein [Brevibacillus centrosporus]MEC2127554.1 dipeptide/oligopeptide/nickel ABC transporter permease/ATP-binding protein [Brevibacillus centrosporus]RNB67827.1 ATP-binding cassette domain-containing protein [Brevibacillus centrosporus]GED30203.1 peptide ABC transporter ATP-binding protein [Brevibacillus centrosporus]